MKIYYKLKNIIDSTKIVECSGHERTPKSNI